MNILKSIFTGTLKLNRFCYLTGALFIPLLALVTIIDVVGRYIFNHPLAGALEISDLVMAVIIFLTLPYSVFLKAHIKVDLVVKKLHQRKQQILELSTSILSLSFVSLVFSQSIRIAINKWGSYTDQLHIPTFYVALLVPFGCLLSSIYLVDYIIWQVNLLRTGQSKEKS